MIKLLLYISLWLASCTAHAQLISKEEVQKWVKIQLDTEANRPDPVAFGLRMKRDLNLTPADAQRLNTSDPSQLSASDQALYRKMKAAFQEELDAEIAAQGVKYGMSIHQYYQIKNYYEQDAKFQALVQEITRQEVFARSVE